MIYGANTTNSDERALIEDSFENYKTSIVRSEDWV
jgi:hypothetical protein